MVALLFKVNHSHKKQASQINATCSCAAKCVGSSHMMYLHCFMHCAQDISSSCPPCRLHPRPTLWIAIGYCFCLATMHTYVPYSMDSMGQHRQHILSRVGTVALLPARACPSSYTSHHISLVSLITLSSLLHYELCLVSVWDPKNTSPLVIKSPLLCM